MSYRLFGPDGDQAYHLHMNALAEKRRWTAEEYLAFERESPDKHEFLDGEISLMAGARREHDLIVVNLLAELRNGLRGRPCKAHSSDMRVHVPVTGLYTYPDVSVACPARFLDERQDTLVNPSVIFEVLSTSTEAYDRGAKFASYRSIPSLQDYVLLSQERALIEHFHRQEDGSWVLREARAGGSLALPSIGCILAVNEVYLDVFAAQDEATSEGKPG